MKNSKSDSRGLLEAAFDKAVETAAKRDAPEADLDNMVDALAGAAASEDEIREMRDFYLAHSDLVDAAVHAMKKTLASPEGAAQIRALQSYLELGPCSRIDSEQVVQEMIASGNFDALVAAQTGSGLKAIGIGVAGSFSLLLAGAEKGYEGLWILAQNSYGGTAPNALTTRSWGEVTTGVDLIASGGINLSFWFTTPETALLAGVFVDVIPLIGLRFSYIKMKPLPDQVTRPVKRPDAAFAGFSLRISVGLELGGGVFVGTQQVPAGSKIIPPVIPPVPPRNLMTFYLFNTATNTDVIQIGQSPTSLSATLTNPSGGSSGPVVLAANVTVLSIAMPDFMSASDVAKMTVTNLSGWRQNTSTGQTLNFTYVGANNSAWTAPLKFTIGNVQSSSTTATNGKAIALVTNGDDTQRASAQLNLVNLVFDATLTSWNLKLGSGMSVAASNPSSGSNVPVSCPTTNANGFIPLSQVIDNTNSKKPTTWDVGVIFVQSSSGGTIAPTMQAVWANANQPKGTPYVSTPLTWLTQSDQTMTAYYENKDASTLVVTAKLN